MPGIFGYLKRTPETSIEVKSLPGKMGEILTHFSKEEIFCKELENGFSGVYGFKNTERLKLYAEDNLIVMVDGEILGVENYSRDTFIENRGDAGLVRDFYVEYGEDLVYHISGAFTCLIYDENQNKLLIFNDKFALRSLYYWCDEETIIFGSKIKAILQHPGVDNDLNYNTLESLISVGFQAGDETLISGVRALPQGSLLTFNRNGLKIEEYDVMDYQTEENFDEVEGLNRLKELFVKSVSRCVDRGGGRVGSFLSGGYDSRLVAGLASKMIPALPVFTHQTGHSGDVEIAREIARSLGIDFNFIPLRDDYIKENASRHTWVTEGEADASCSHFYEFMPVVDDYVGIILDGTAGDLVMGSYSDPRVMKMMEREDIFNYIFFERVNKYFAYKELKYILTEDFYKKTGDFSYDKTKSIFMRIPETSPNIMLDLFYLQSYIPRWIFSGLKNIRQFVEVRSPFFNYELFDFALSLPYEYRYHRRLYRTAMTELLPKVSDIISTNLFLSPSSSEVDLFLARIKNKLTSLYSRIFGIELRKHTKYTYDYNRAMRTHCRDYITNLLLSERTLSRGIFKVEFIEETVRSHLSGEKNLMRQLGYMITIELFIRLFVDERPQAGGFDIYGNYT